MVAQFIQIIRARNPIQHPMPPINTQISVVRGLSTHMTQVKYELGNVVHVFHRFFHAFYIDFFNKTIVIVQPLIDIIKRREIDLFEPPCIGFPHLCGFIIDIRLLTQFEKSIDCREDECRDQNIEELRLCHKCGAGPGLAGGQGREKRDCEVDGRRDVVPECRVEILFFDLYADAQIEIVLDHKHDSPGGREVVDGVILGEPF